VSEVVWVCSWAWGLGWVVIRWCPLRWRCLSYLYWLANEWM